MQHMVTQMKRMRHYFYSKCGYADDMQKNAFIHMDLFKQHVPFRHNIYAQFRTINFQDTQHFFLMKNVIFYALTALRKKLRVNHLKRILSDYTSWTFGFETTIDPLDFRLTETRCLAEGFQAVWAVTWRCFQIFKFRI